MGSNWAVSSSMRATTLRGQAGAYFRCSLQSAEHKPPQLVINGLTLAAEGRRPGHVARGLTLRREGSRAIHSQ